MVQLYEVQTDTDVGIRWVGSYSFFNRIRNGKRAICQIISGMPQNRLDFLRLLGLRERI